MIKIDSALDIIENYHFKREKQIISIDEALSYTLATNIHSSINVPSFRKSAMDGYAIKYKDLEIYQEFNIIESIYAGEDIDVEYVEASAIKIMTGAKIPGDYDIVIMKELANINGDTVTFNIPKVKLNKNICEIGEDIKVDQLVFEKGEKLTAIKIASLQSIGVFEVEVYKKPKILMVTTGNEVANSLEEMKAGKIFNSNKAYIQNRFKELNLFNVEHKHILDEKEEFINLVNKFHRYDFVVTTGAISVGDKDIIRKYIETNEVKIFFDKINIMPGGPCAFWEVNEIPIISLAGSPFANFVTFELLVTTFLSNFTYDNKLKPQVKNLKLKGSWQKKVKKDRFVKVYVEDGYCNLIADNHKASSLYEMSKCNALMRINTRDEDVLENNKVKVYILGE